MTPSMRLNDLIRKYQAAFSSNNPWATGVVDDINEAFSLGHEFGLERAVNEVAVLDCFGTILRRVRGLKVERVKNVPTTSEDFL